MAKKEDVLNKEVLNTEEVQEDIKESSIEETAKETSKEEVSEEPISEETNNEPIKEETEVTTEDEQPSVEETETDEVVQELPEHHESVDTEDNQNYKISSDLIINGYKSELEETVRRNPQYKSVKELSAMLSKPESEIKTMKYYTDEKEDSLMNKRDYYEIKGHEGKYMPREADLSWYKSPQKSFNLALDQVKILIEKGYSLKNNRTGDMIKKRNVDEYIAKWSKDKNPIISNKVYY